MYFQDAFLGSFVLLEWRDFSKFHKTESERTEKCSDFSYIVINCIAIRKKDVFKLMFQDVLAFDGLKLDMQ